MAKRTYGASSAYTQTALRNYEYDDEVDDASESDIVGKMTPVLGGNPVRPLIIVAVVLLVLFLALTIAYIYVVKFDKGLGESSADKAAEAFVTNITAEDNSALYAYVPRQLRTHPTLVDDGYMSMLKQLDEVYDVDVSNLDIVSSQDLSPERLEECKNTIKNLYDVDLDLSLAKSISMSVVYDTANDGLSADERKFDVDVVSIKNGFRWYVVPGLIEYNELTPTENTIAEIVEPESVPEVPNDVDSVVSEDVSDTTVDSLAKTGTTDVSSIVEKKTEIVKEVKELEPGKKVLSALKEGKFSYNDKDYIVPGKIEDFGDIFTIRYGHNGLEEDTEIMANYFVEKIPVSFIDSNYSHADLMVCLGNDTDEVIKAKDSLITCLGITWPQTAYEYQIYDYPLIYLPGNVTFGTTYDDVVELYGELTPAENASRVHLYSMNTKVYQIELNNEHNFLYLQFDNDKLVGMEWYYFDFNEY